MEILIKDNKTNKIIKFKYTDQKTYNKMLKSFREWEQQKKLEIIPQDINEYIKTGVKR